MKIFLPTYIYETKKSCSLFGEILKDNEKQSVSYYVIETTQLKPGKGDYRRNYLPCIGNISHERVKLSFGPLCFYYNKNTPNIYLDTSTISVPSNAKVFLYDPDEFLQIAESETNRDDIGILRQLHKSARNDELLYSKHKQSSIRALLVAILNLPLQLMTSLFIYIMEFKVAMKMLNKTAFYEHYKEWRKFHFSRKRNWNIALDKILGILVMIFLIFYVPEPTDYVIKTSYLVIDKLRLLLRSLKGAPIGLKLNVHLNNFFLDCFSYHVDLWATFLSIIEPAVQQIFIPITLLGSMGLSCQLALFADIISIVGLHAHCFYIYAAALYKVEILGLAVLWKVVRGKRFNLLKQRVESHNYTNRQLYLATIFFTTLLFLFPTILVYYVVFTTLRLCTVSVTWLLKTLRRRILEFPLQDLYEWFNNNYRDRDSIHIKYLGFMPCSCPIAENSKCRICVFKIHVKTSSLSRVFSSESGVLKELTTNEDLTLKTLFKRILEGKF